MRGIVRIGRSKNETNAHKMLDMMEELVSQYRKGR